MVTGMTLERAREVALRRRSELIASVVERLNRMGISLPVEAETPA